MTKHVPWHLSVRWRDGHKAVRERQGVEEWSYMVDHAINHSIKFSWFISYRFSHSLPLTMWLNQLCTMQIFRTHLISLTQVVYLLQSLHNYTIRTKLSYQTDCTHHSIHVAHTAHVSLTFSTHTERVISQKWQICPTHVYLASKLMGHHQHL